MSANSISNAALVAAADEVAGAERRDRDRGREHERGGEPPRQVAAGRPELGASFRGRGASRGSGAPAAARPRRARRGRAVKPLALGPRTSRPTRSSKRGRSPLFLVERGRRAATARCASASSPCRAGSRGRSATSLWESPPQYASSSTDRSVAGSSSSARCTRQAPSRSRRALGPGAGPRVGRLADRLGRRPRSRSTIGVPRDGVEPGAAGPRSSS